GCLGHHARSVRDVTRHRGLGYLREGFGLGRRTGLHPTVGELDLRPRWVDVVGRDGHDLVTADGRAAGGFQDRRVEGVIYDRHYDLLPLAASRMALTSAASADSAAWSASANRPVSTYSPSAPSTTTVLPILDLARSWAIGP